MSLIFNREGFWRSDREPRLPKPRPNRNPWIGQRDFLTQLAFKESKAEQILYRGFSVCRICGKPNGSGEYKSDSWVWPSGFKHYVDEHNVRPSLAFQEYILGHKVGTK